MVPFYILTIRRLTPLPAIRLRLVSFSSENHLFSLCVLSHDARQHKHKTAVKHKANNFFI